MRLRRATSWAVGAALVVFGAGAALPIWTAWYFSSWEGIGHSGPLWTAIGQVPATHREEPNQFWRLQETNVVLGVALILVATAVGWGTYRTLARRGLSQVARDFVEGPAGSLPDGRVESDIAPDRRPSSG